MIPRVPRACSAGHSGVVSNDAHRPEDQVPGAAPAEDLRLVVQARDAEIEMLRLLAQKLKLRLARRNRMIFGSASERFADGTPTPQGRLLEGELLDGIGPKKLADAVVSPAANTAANDKSVDRSLPEHLPREPHVHRPETTPEHHDARGQPQPQDRARDGQGQRGPQGPLSLRGGEEGQHAGDRATVGHVTRRRAPSGRGRGVESLAQEAGDRACGQIFARAKREGIFPGGPASPQPNANEMTGRQPLPMAVKRIKGTLQKCRINPNEPRPTGRLGEPPEYMSDAAQEAWRYAIENAPEGLLSSLDASVLERWANCAGLYREALSKINRAGVAGMIIKTPSGILRRSPLMDVIRDLAAEMKGYESEMGFTPASRSRVSVAPREPSASDPWSEIAG